MDLGLAGKTVAVMAASKGLGKAAALAFAKEGATVYISSRQQAELHETRDEIIRAANNKDVHAITCDVSDEHAITSFFAQVAEKSGGVDILVNNVGGPVPGGFSDVQDSDWLNSFEKNLLSYIRTSRAVLPYMKEQQFGRIVNISSSSTKEVIDGLILSNTFRAGMVGFAKTLAREVAADNILVNTVGPGRISTDRMTELNAENAKKQAISAEEMLGRSIAQIPAGRLGTPDEFAQIIVFLASPANAYLTGQSLVVDGGLLKAL